MLPFSGSEAFQLLFRQGQLVIVVDTDTALQHMAGDGMGLFQ